MTNLVLRLCFLALLPSTVLSQPIFVQSGEHEDFSRFVIQIPKGKSWGLDQTEGKVAINIKGHSDGFDTSRVFDFIPRSRVTRIAATQSQLSLILDCDCEVEAFAVDGGHVAIDVASPKSKVEPVAPVLARLRPPSLQKPMLEVSEKNVFATTSQPLFPIKSWDPLNLAEIAILSDVQDNLVRELGSATTRGVLESAHVMPKIRKPQIDTRIFSAEPIPEKKIPSTDTFPKDGNIRISTSLDTTSQNKIAKIPTDIACPKEKELDISRWGDNRPFDIQVSEARESLYGEFDRLDSSAAVKLARLYLYFGFGAEAKQVLNLDSNIREGNQNLFEISDIIEKGTIEVPNNLISLAECGGNASLWATLANPDAKSPNIDATPVLLATNSLPVHLRKFIAPMLSDIFLLRGDHKNAATAMRSLERSPESLEPVGKMAQAKVNLENGNNITAKEQFEDVANDNSSQSANALVALVDSKIASGESIDPETINLIEAYRSELREAKIGPDLDRAYILSLISAGQYSSVISQINFTSPEKDDKKNDVVRDYFLQELVKKSSDIEFLDVMLQKSDVVLQQVSPELKIDLASRLLNIGFGQDAKKIIDSIPDKPKNEARQILAAQVAISSGKPFQAQAELIGITSPSALAILADAKQMTGAYQEAFTLYKNANNQEKAEQSAWLSENWRELVMPGAPNHVAATLVAPNDITSEEGGVGLLNRTEEAVSESANARQVLTDLLATSRLKP
ncbi:MAG: hypothetical protein WA790_17330 [Sulfitobacter sp.]